MQDSLRRTVNKCGAPFAAPEVLFVLKTPFFAKKIQKQ